MTASNFDSFNQSTLGAFNESTLKVRGIEELPNVLWAGTGTEPWLLFYDEINNLIIEDFDKLDSDGGFPKSSAVYKKTIYVGGDVDNFLAGQPMIYDGNTITSAVMFLEKGGDFLNWTDFEDYISDIIFPNIGRVNRLKVIENILYIITDTGIFSFDGENFSVVVFAAFGTSAPFPPEITSTEEWFMDIIKFNGTFYVCGRFSEIDIEEEAEPKGVFEFHVRGFAKLVPNFPGSNINPIVEYITADANNQKGIDYSADISLTICTTMRNFENNLYIGGFFDGTKNGGDDGWGNIISFNGSTHTKLQSGLNDKVNGIEFFNNDLYLLGEFTADGLSNTMNYLSRWDRSSFNEVGTSEAKGLDAIVTASHKADGKLYGVGEFFSTGGTIPVSLGGAFSIDGDIGEEIFNDQAGGPDTVHSSPTPTTVTKTFKLD
jgi:hypothetical protein